MVVKGSGKAFGCFGVAREVVEALNVARRFTRGVRKRSRNSL